MVRVLTHAIAGQLLLQVPLLVMVSAGQVTDSTNEWQGCITPTVKDSTVLCVSSCDSVQR